VITGKLQREIVLDLVKRARLSSPDQDLPGAVKVRHGRAANGKVVHYYLNFSGTNQQVDYAYGSGRELLTNTSARHGSTLALRPWDLATSLSNDEC
jgi:beta-galactosidase